MYLCLTCVIEGFYLQMQIYSLMNQHFKESYFILIVLNLTWDFLNHCSAFLLGDFSLETFAFCSELYFTVPDQFMWQCFSNLPCLLCFFVFVQTSEFWLKVRQAEFPSKLVPQIISHKRTHFVNAGSGCWFLYTTIFFCYNYAIMTISIQCQSLCQVYIRAWLQMKK